MYTICANMWLALLMPVPAHSPDVLTGPRSGDYFFSGGVVHGNWVPGNWLTDMPVLQTCCKIDSPVFYGAFLPRVNIPCQGIWPALVDQSEPIRYAPTADPPLDFGDVLIFSNVVPPSNYRYERIGVHFMATPDYLRKLGCKDQFAEIAVEVPANPIAAMEAQRMQIRMIIELLRIPTPEGLCNPFSYLVDFEHIETMAPEEMVRTLAERRRALQESRMLTKNRKNISHLVGSLIIFDVMVWHFDPSRVATSELVALSVQEEKDAVGPNDADLWTFLLARDVPWRGFRD